MLSSVLSDPLRAFYPTFTTIPALPSGAYPVFQDFVDNHRQDIIYLLRSRLVQTNEVRRCAYLFPALSFAASHFEARPLALVEIGTSAGLNLIWDRYRYSYGDSMEYGDSSSPVLVTSTFRGNARPILSAPMPAISHRIGLDLNIIDTQVTEQINWLRSLVWPEHLERRNLLDASLKRRNEMQLDLREGDGFAMLMDIAEQIADESVLCVYHTHVANQISKEAKETFLGSVELLGAKRDVIHVSNNIKPNLHFTAYRSRKMIDMPLANTDDHGRWIEWL